MDQGVRYPDTFPLMEGRSQILYKRTSNERTQISNEQFYDTLRNLQHVIWCPYLRISPNKIPKKYYANYKRAIASTILVSFYMVTFHKPELAPLQFGYQSVMQYRYPLIPNINSFKKRPKKNIDPTMVDSFVKFVQLNKKNVPMIGEVIGKTLFLFMNFLLKFKCLLNNYILTLLPLWKVHKTSRMITY